MSITGAGQVLGLRSDLHDPQQKTEVCSPVVQYLNCMFLCHIFDNYRVNYHV